MIKRIARMIKMIPAETRRSFRAEYHWYPGFAAWSVRVYDRVLRKAPRAPLPFRKSLRLGRFKSMNTPFYFRLGSSDLQLNQTIRFRGEYAPVIEDPFTDVRQVVDLGSNAGYTVRLWRELFPEARIIAVEPDPDNARVCRLNAEIVPFTRFDLLQACVDGTSGTVWLDRSALEHQFHIGQGPSTGGIQVPALTVPEVLERAQADAEIGLLKCDVQGAEQAIFRDCSRWIGGVRNMIVEVHPPYRPDNLLSDLTRNGWRWSRHIVHKTDDLFVLFFWAGDPAPHA